MMDHSDVQQMTLYEVCMSNNAIYTGRIVEIYCKLVN